MGGDDDAAIGGEVDLDDGRFFSEGCLVVVAEEAAPPGAGVVLKEAGAAAAGDGLVARVVGAVDVVGDGEAGGVTALVCIGGAEVVAAIGLEEDGALGAEVVGAAACATLGVVRRRVVRVGERDGVPVAGEAGEIVFQLHDAGGGAGGEVDLAVGVLEERRVDGVDDRLVRREGVDVGAGGLAGGAFEDGDSGGRDGEADVVVAAQEMDLGCPDGAAGLVVEAAPGLLPRAFLVHVPDQAEVVPGLEIGRAPQLDAAIVGPDILAGGAREIEVAVAAVADDGVAHLDVDEGLDGGEESIGDDGAGGEVLPGQGGEWIGMYPLIGEATAAGAVSSVGAGVGDGEASAANA